MSYPQHEPDSTQFRSRERPAGKESQPIGGYGRLTPEQANALYEWTGQLEAAGAVFNNGRTALFWHLVHTANKHLEPKEKPDGTNSPDDRQPA